MEKIRFLHIPKTAGSTITLILRRQYRGKGMFNFTGDFSSDVKRYYALSDDVRENMNLFTGHSPFVTGIREVDEIAIITLLRDPVNRVKSYCQHVSEGKISDPSNTIFTQPFRLDDFLERENGELSNLQTRMLINTKKGGDPLFRDLSSAEARDRALDNLFNKISIFGLQEYFDESLINFQTKLGWKTIFYSPINTKNMGKLIDFKEHHLEKIAELNKIDIEVYHSAKSKFLKIIGELEFDSEKLKQFQQLNVLAKHVLSINCSYAFSIESD